ncbi:MAG TPA: Flp family type IVb pilin [Firmicutes bacterium]|nr:Flp family type IVb pilin [Bacillota bacterium]
MKAPVAFLSCEEGQALTEYSLVLAFIAMAVILLVKGLGTVVSDLLQQALAAFAGGE